MAGKVEALMKLKLPKLTGRWLGLTVCGSVKATKSAPLPSAARALTRKRVVKVAAVGRGDDRSYLVVMVSGKKESAHLHTDLISTRIAKRPPPEIRATPDEVRRVFQSFSGVVLDALVCGTFSLSADEVPGFLRSSMVAAESAGVTLRSTGGTVAVTGAPVERIEWREGKSGPAGEKNLILTLDARTSLTVGPSYITDAYNLMDTAFRALISESTQNEPRS